jgi:transcriptional regulator with XRE-family HTH domain
MNEYLTTVDVREMGARFSMIRKKLGLNQKQVASELESTQIKISALERGTNVLSPLFLRCILFYTQYVSSEVLFAKQFDIEDPNLFNKNAALTNVAKAKLEILKEELLKEMDAHKQELDARLSSAINLL